VFPHTFELFGHQLSIWDLMFLIGALAGYFVFQSALRTGTPSLNPRLLVVRWIVIVYVAVLGAQWFAYAFDLNESLVPPRGVTWARHYFHPFQGAKTLYGAIVVLPIAMAIVCAPAKDLPYRQALERITPAMMTTLALVRVGCFLQGCCYGVRSDWFGLRFGPGSPVHNRQAYEGLIDAADRSLPVVATQLLEALALAVLAAWSMRRIRAGRPRVFVDAVSAYSVWRFIVEFARADPDRNQYGVFSTSQWIAVCILVMYAAWRLAQASRRSIRASRLVSDFQR
jgi:phosphatidylglycerol:prolipoprotein diacylglycerol transferase